MYSYSDILSINFQELTQNGYLRLPSLVSYCDLEEWSKKIILSNNYAIFAEAQQQHISFLEKLGITTTLAGKLYEYAHNVHNYCGDRSNQYHIARYIEPKNNNESYRSHYDSHLLTLVLPLQIPKASSQYTTGQLVYKPNARRAPKSEIQNIFQKISSKKYASELAVTKLMEEEGVIVENFTDYCPLLFLGRTTLHTNLPLSKFSEVPRLTLLAHFFDPNPTHGIGAFLRLLRRR